MPALTIRDDQGKTLVSSDLSGEGLGKYFKAAASLRSAVPLAQTFARPLTDAAGARQIALTLDTHVAVGRAHELSLTAGANVTIGVHQAGDAVLGGADLQAPVLVPNGTTAVSLTLEALLEAAAAGVQGSIGFGFGAGTRLRYAYIHPFNTVGASPHVGDAVKTLIASAVYPADADDLQRLPVGALVSVAGEGELTFRGSASLSSSANLLATPGIKLVGQVAVTAGAAVNVGAEWTLSGGFELRLTKTSGTAVRLAYHRRRARSLTVSVRALAGLSVQARGQELLATLMRAISPDPEPDLLALVNAGLDDAAIEAIQEAVAASVDRSLTVSAQLEISSLDEREALFTWDIDLGRLDDRARAAIDEALHGRLAAISEAAAAPSSPFTVGVSAERTLTRRRTAWRINLLGILNASGLVEFVRDSRLTFDPASGALTAADAVSARRIRVRGKPLESQPEELRKVLLESLLVTAAYQASHALGSTVSLTGEQLYVEQRSKTTRTDLADHYRALIALGLCDAAERDRRLGTTQEFGGSIFNVQNRFDAAACDAMFLDAAGRPHESPHFETVARRALLALLPPDDPERSFRRLALEPDTVWAQVRSMGGAIGAALPDHIRLSVGKLALVQGDVITVMWWATAMARAARELVGMRTFLGDRDAAALVGHPQFEQAREQLARALGGVVATTGARFDDPWDVLAMDAAAARLGSLDAVIVSTRFAVRYADDAGGGPVAGAGGAPRVPEAAGLAAAPMAARAQARDWTDDERATFTRHVVNLRNGQLSSDGTFTSTPEQVERIFTEHLPAWLARQQGLGLPARVLFYAHGGLVEEEEGLLPVLARRRFWELNGVYPVYFVWETGLRETLTDIVRGAVRPSRDARGAVSDFAIERLSRPGGQPIWSQMKRSAGRASGPGGGAALVAELTGRLWKAAGGRLELHALGHSAGAIFNAFFLPRLLAQRPTGVPAITVRSLHLLAPAITTALFKQTLTALVGSGKPIGALTTYTMTDEFERTDPSMSPYGKSLLYLVSGAFEDDVPTPILGLQKSLKSDLQMIRFFGLAGTEKVADIVFSKTDPGVPLQASSQSTTHGGFDNDVATMTSVIRRVLDVPDTTPVVGYFEDAVPGFDRGAVGMVPAEGRAIAGAGPRAAAAAGGTRAARRPAAPLAPAVRPSRRVKQWTVMVWMAGDNDLETFGDRDLLEMKRVGSTGEIDIVAQFDSMRDDRTRRYHVTSRGTVDDDVVAELGETNTGDPAVAVDFFRWAIERYPAERLLGVIWNHGSGIDEQDIYERGARGVGPVVRGANGEARHLVRAALSGRHRRALFSTTVAQATSDRAIAYDDTSRDFLDNVELKKVLADVKRQSRRTLDIVGFDACLMNMVEVACQLKGTAGLVVGSEELEPGDGWPYDKVLAALAADPAMAPADLATRIVNLYIASYRSGNVTQSALDLAHLGAITKSVDTLARALTKAIKQPAEFAAVTRALNGTQRFDTADFVNLGHFCAQMATRSATAAVKAAARATIDTLKPGTGFVVAERDKGTRVKDASGVSIYFPRGPVSKTYRRLDFARATAWSAFLEAYHKA